MAWMAFAPLAIKALPVAMQIGGAVMSAVSNMSAGDASEQDSKNAQAVANYNAQVKENEARARKNRALAEQKMQAKRGERVKSSLYASLGAAGGLGSPVAADLAAAQAAELELENLTIGYEGETEATRLKSGAAMDRYQGSIFRQRGKNAKSASRYAAAGSLLRGFERTYVY